MVDADRISQLREKIQKWKRQKYDIVGRAGKFGLPLVLGNAKSESFDEAFHCALAELLFSYEKDEPDLRVLLESYFDEKTVLKRFIKKGRINFLGRKYQALTKRKIIAIAYPWYNQWLYLDLARIARVHRLDLTPRGKPGLSPRDEHEGRYRYFRSYPLDSGTFQLSDGYITVRRDPLRNMLVFGQVARMYKGFADIVDIKDESTTLFEHRGFLIPGKTGNLFLISFREEAIRFSIVRVSPGNWIGTVLTSTRKTGRPFAAKALIVREGESDWYDQEIKAMEKDPKYLDPEDPQCQAIKAELRELNGKTIFPDDGFMWGNAGE
jgi:hypothetical protein